MKKFKFLIFFSPFFFLSNVYANPFEEWAQRCEAIFADQEAKFVRHHGPAHIPTDLEARVKLSNRDRDAGVGVGNDREYFAGQMRKFNIWHGPLDIMPTLGADLASELSRYVLSTIQKILKDKFAKPRFSPLIAADVLRFSIPKNPEQQQEIEFVKHDMPLPDLAEHYIVVPLSFDPQLAGSLGLETAKSDNDLAGRRFKPVLDSIQYNEYEIGKPIFFDNQKLIHREAIRKDFLKNIQSKYLYVLVIAVY